jgi:hypothetical protein
MAGRIRELRLNIRCATRREGETRLLGERFTQSVLERFCEIVERRFPGRDILIRRMDLRCTLLAEQLDDAAGTERYAEELAAALIGPEITEDVALDGRGSADVWQGWSDVPPLASADSAPAIERASRASVSGAVQGQDLGVAGDRPIVGRRTLAADATGYSLEPDEPGMSARIGELEDRLISALRREAQGAGATEFASWGSADGQIPVSASARREIVNAALAQLDGQGELMDILVRLAPATVAVLLAAMDIDSGLREVARHRGAPNGEQQQRAGDEAGAGVPAQVTAVDERLRELARQLPPTLSSGAAAVALQVRAGAVLTGDGLPARSGGAAPSATPRGPARDGAEGLNAGAVGEQSAFPEGSAIPTRYGGLFYLLSLVLELGIGESLWEVCLDERRVLSRAAAAILGEDAVGDAAPLLFGGITRRELLEPLDISAEQQEEAAADMLAGMVAALRRLGIGKPPVPTLDLVEAPAGRLLVATCHFPLAIFAWPAADGAAVDAGIGVFLRYWPPEADAPVGSDIVLRSDRSGRLRPGFVPNGTAGCLLPEAATAAAGAVLAQVCGSLLRLFRWRLAAHEEDAVSTGAELVSRYLALPARIALADEATTILMPMDRTDMALRRAALDRDPGWVPWLRRTVRIEFEPQGPGEVF